MSTWLLILVTLAYLFCSIDLTLKHEYAKALIFGGYFLANIGMIVMVR